MHPYLSFHGNCEEAMNFYASLFHGEVSGINRYEGSPMQEHVPADWASKVMHSTLVAPGITFMGSDSTRFIAGNQVSLSIVVQGNAEGKRAFDALADGGEVEMPLGEVFWGGSFGMLVDRYGIRWMVSC